MCGIAGQFNYGKDKAVQPEVIRRMADAIRHRGPDDDGYFEAGGVGLGFRRLSIIDLAGGHQPMSDGAASVWVVFNGEIYNFKELRAELQQAGHQFRTTSDTEVIVHGYKQWGTDVFARLNGMFGLAIWDVAAQRLVVARDAMGIKLVYFRDADGELTFGSEIRAVRAAAGSAADVDPIALQHFLTLRYTPSPRTLFRGIRKLAPGTMLVAERGTCREERWYNYTPPADAPAITDDAAATTQLLELYKGAVERHLIADVPVGLLLSGGLDSGLLLALMNEHGSGWPAYTVGYGESFEDDELTQAAETAAFFGARHVPVRLDRDEFERSLPGIVGQLEEPVTSSSIVPMYFVCQRARADVKVVLVGQGPDELFCGYKRHLGVRYGEWWRLLPPVLQSMIRGTINRLPRNEMLKRGVHSLGFDDRLLRYEQVFALAPPDVITGLFRKDVVPSLTESMPAYWRDLGGQLEHFDELAGFQLIELRSSLPDEILMFSDKLSMAHGLEARVPYLDKTVVEFAQRLPTNLKIRGTTKKWLHRAVCQQFLPPAFVARKKRGFAVNVVDDWFHSSLRGVLPEMLLDDGSLMFTWLEPRAVRALLDDHRLGRQDNHKLLFSLVMVEQWLRQAQRPSPLATESALAASAGPGTNR
jgi:asparagine synthase (glutamine-hydrolysing)